MGKSIMKMRSHALLLVTLTVFWTVLGCGQKKPKVPETNKTPATDSTSGADPSLQEFDPEIGGGEPPPPEETGTPEEAAEPPVTEEPTEPNADTTQTQGTGNDPSTVSGLGGNPLTSLFALIKDPQQGMKSLLSSLISTLTGQTGGGGTSSLIAGLLGTATPSPATNPNATQPASAGSPSPGTPAAEAPAAVPTAEPAAPAGG